MIMRSLMIASALSLLAAACQSPSQTRQSPAASYQAGLAKASMIKPAGTTNADLQRMAPAQRHAVFDSMLAKAGVHDCKIVSSRITNRSEDGRGIWNVNCERGIRQPQPDYLFYMPANASDFAQVLRCRLEEGGSKCSSF